MNTCVKRTAPILPYLYRFCTRSEKVDHGKYIVYSAHGFHILVPAKVFCGLIQSRTVCTVKGTIFSRKCILRDSFFSLERASYDWDWAKLEKTFPHSAIPSIPRTTKPSNLSIYDPTIRRTSSSVKKSYGNWEDPYSPEFLFSSLRTRPLSRLS